MYSRFIGRLESFKPKNKWFFKGTNKHYTARYYAFCGKKIVGQCMKALIPCISVNQCLRHNLGYKQKIIQFIRRNQVYFSSSNVSTDTTVIVKDYKLSEKFTFCFKITIKWNLTKSHATKIKQAKYNLM